MHSNTLDLENTINRFLKRFCFQHKVLSIIQSSSSSASSLHAQLSKSCHGQRSPSLLMPFTLCQPTSTQHREKLKPVSHFLRVGQKVIAVNELCSGALVMTAPQEDLNENMTQQLGSAVAKSLFSEATML